MKLLAYTRGPSSGRRLGLQTDDGIRDLTAALGATDVGGLLARPDILEGLGSADGELVEDAVSRAPIARP